MLPIRFSCVAWVLISVTSLSHHTTATAHPHAAAAVLRGSRHDPTAERLPRRLQEDPASTSTAPSEFAAPNSTTTVVAAAAAAGTGEPNGTVAMVTTAVPSSSSEAVAGTEGGADNLAMTTASPTASPAASPTASPSATLVENAIASTNETSTEIIDANAAIPSPSSSLPTLPAGNDNVTALVPVAPTNNNESATSSTTPPTSGGMVASPPNDAGQNVTTAENATSSTWTTATQSTVMAGNVTGGDDWFDGTTGGNVTTTTDDDAAGNYSYNNYDDDDGANDDWENTSAWSDHSPSRHPTPRPTYEYKPSEDDMLAATEMNPGEFSDDYIPSKGGGGGGGTLQEKVAAYLEGVESAEEMKQDRNVRIVAGVLTVVFVLLWLVTAQQTMENPDGLCAR
ncbi:hypothetical protein HJC23_003696 [Cyclotella cryptica]|uniref:Uncharacterized protein n=1 Tax=Cyclotella cryptica TaxID=29204 RepID=A0ABD3QTL1_9STRA